jgi:predicted Zn-dependent peptidase
MLKHTVIEKKLANGSAGLFVDIPDSTLIELRVCFRAGDVFCNDQSKWETAHVMEHLMLGACIGYGSATDFKSDIEKNGAYINATTQHVDMIYEATCPDFEWNEFLQLFMHNLNFPTFIKREFEAELSNVREELLGTSNDPGTKLQEHMSKVYGFNTKTEQERIDLLHNITFDDIQDHYARTHYPENMRFIIAGNLSGRYEQIESIIGSSYFGGPKVTGQLDYPLEIAKKPARAIYIEDKSLSNVYFSVDLFKQKSLEDEEMYALSIVNHILNGTLHSRVLGRARKEGLIYHVGSDFYRTKSQSAMWFSSQISKENLQPFLNILVSEIIELSNGKLSDTELKAAKRYALGGYQLDAQTAAGLCDGYISLYLFDNRIEEYYHRFPEKLKAIKKADVLSSLRTILEDEVWGVGLLGNVTKQLQQEVYKQISALWAK